MTCFTALAQLTKLDTRKSLTKRDPPHAPHQELSPRLTQVITKCAKTPNQTEDLTRTLAQMAWSSTIGVANKFDSEEEAQKATVNPCMRRVWTECERIASSLAVHFALSHAPGRKEQ